jgi:Putative prokaryotic signal transducing protein
MTDSNLVVVHSFNNRAEADLAKSALEAAGVDAMVQADDGGGMRPAMAWAGSGMQILVRAEDAEVAREILDLPANNVTP